MASKLPKKLIGFFIISLTGVLLAILLESTNSLENLENQSWDLRLRYIASQSEPDPNIAIILIDQNSLNTFAKEQAHFWPWPRSLYVPVIKFLEQAGANALAIDMLFTEQSINGVEDDKTLAAELNGEMPVILAMQLQSGAPLAAEFKPILQKTQQHLSKSRFNLDLFPSYSTAAIPTFDILDQAKFIANVGSGNDKDGIFRHISIGGKVDNIPFLTLPFALFNAVHPDRSFEIPIDKNMAALSFKGPEKTYRTYNFIEIYNSGVGVLNGEQPTIPFSQFKNSYVLLGVNAPGLLDLRPTPLSKIHPGVEIHATALDNLLNNSFIKKVSSSNNILFATTLILLITISALYLRKMIVLIAAIATIFIYSVIISFYLATQNYWIHLAIPLTISTLCLMSALLFQYWTEGSNFRFIKQAFKFYVSPAVIDKIIEDPSVLRLGGERRELTLFFSDIAGFTGISESIEPTALVNLLNRFLTEMTDIILANEGTIDKYVGDAIVAFWNAPVPIEDHAVKAVRAAIECQQKIRELQEEFVRIGAPIALRIGIHTGDVAIGNFGSEKRFNYTVIGDAANVASRLEGVNKIFATNILISEKTYELSKHQIKSLEIASVRVVGREEPITVYTPKVEVPRLDESVWSEALNAYKNGDRTKAGKIFSSFAGNKTAEIYLNRLTTEPNSSYVWDAKSK